MNYQQYKDWRLKYTKDLQKVITSDYYREFTDRLYNEINPAGSHYWESWLYDIEEFVLEVIANVKEGNDGQPVS